MIYLTNTYRFSFLSDQRRTKTFFALLALLLCMTQHVVADPLFISIPDNEGGNNSNIWFDNDKDSIKQTDEAFIVKDSVGVFLRKKKLAVKTNMLLYGAYVPGYNRWAPIPNVAIELYPMKGHFTFGASFDMPWWQDYNAHKYFQFRNYQLEARYYPRGAVRTDKSGDHVYEENIEAYEHNKKAFTGFYLQAYTHLAVFGICFDANRGWVGEGIGAGVGMGYVLPLSHNGRWKLELGLQAGFFRCKYDPYQFENPVNPAYRDGLYYYKWTKKPSLFKKRQYRWNWIGPTRIGITISYDLLYRRIQKKGVSFKAYETYRTFKAKEADEPNEAERRVKP